MLEFGWLIQVAFDQVKLNEASKLELINSSVALSSAYLKMLESGNSEFVLPEIKAKAFDKALTAPYYLIIYSEISLKYYITNSLILRKVIYQIFHR